MNAKLDGEELLYLIFGFLNLTIFWFDNLYDHDIWSFFWLCGAVGNFLMLIKHWIFKSKENK